MKHSEQSTTYVKREYFSLREMYGPKVFGLFVRRKASAPHAFSLIVSHDQAHRESIFKKDMENITRRLFHLSSNSISYSNSMQININTDLKNNLNQQQLIIYKRCLDYIKGNGLPSNFSLNVLDYLSTFKNQNPNLNEEKIFKRIAVRYRANLLSTGSPKSGGSLYNTLPRPFSPLFFEMIKFTATILSEQEIRKDFEEYYIYGFGEQIKTATQSILQTRNEQQLNSIVKQTLENVQNLWRVPKQLMTKYNQVKIYISNLIPNPSPLLEFICLSYLCHVSSYGLNKEALKTVTPSNVVENIKGFITNTVKSNAKYVKKGWSIFDSIPKQSSFIYSKFQELHSQWNMKSTGIVRYKRKLRLSQAGLVKYAMKLENGIVPGIFGVAL